jgi:hypothetical protein
MSGKRTRYFVTPTGQGDWKVTRQGAKRATNVCEDKEDAVARAKELAKDQPLGQVIIQKGDGKFQTEYTYHVYGEDPERSVAGQGHTGLVDRYIE